MQVRVLLAAFKKENKMPKKPAILPETLKVVYKQAEGINIDMDNAIREFADDMGFVWYAQGLNHVTGERDLCFDREE